MAAIPGWDLTMLHTDRLHNESLGVCRDFGGAMIRDIVELLGDPMEVVFEDVHVAVTAMLLTLM
jgi:hypothetical protein